MSVQDEGVPYDDQLNFSLKSGKDFVFPHDKPRRAVIKNNQANKEREVSAKRNTLLSSSLTNEDDSTQSSNNFCLSSAETSGKTNEREPYDLQESENKKSGFISISYQDIHSEYTKRRYKHVESKVGQYIANIKAQDEKRRNFGKFKRHCSVPEILQGREATVTESDSGSNKHGSLYRSTNHLDHMYDQRNDDLQSYHDSENYNNFTFTTSPFARDSVSENGIFLDKQTYEQLLSDKERKDYLQTKLEEKNLENWRLKQNLDTIRIEYSMCKDKLKQQTQAQRFSGSFRNINSISYLGKTSLQNLLYTQESREKSTQTDKILTPFQIPSENKSGNDMFATPFTPDFNNNLFDHAAVGVLAPVAHRVFKNVATIQPLLLNFSNLVDQDFNNSNINTTTMATRQRSTPIPANISKISSAVSSVPSSSDSAIDIEVAESSNSQRQSRREEFIYYAVAETRNDNQNYTDDEVSTSESGTSSRRKRRKRHSLRSRMIRFFGTFAKCKDPNISSETVGNSRHSEVQLLN